MPTSPPVLRPSTALEMQLALGGYFLSPAGDATITRLTAGAATPRPSALHTLLLQTLLRSDAFYCSPAACAWILAEAAALTPQPLTPAQLPLQPTGPTLYGFCWLGQPLYLPIPPPAQFPLIPGDILALTWSITSWAAQPPAPDPALLIGAFPAVPPQPPGLLPLGPPLLLAEWPLQQSWTAAREPFTPGPREDATQAAGRRELVLRYLSALWAGLHTQALTIHTCPVDPTARMRLAPLQTLLTTQLSRHLEVQVITRPGAETDDNTRMRPDPPPTG